LRTPAQSARHGGRLRGDSIEGDVFAYLAAHRARPADLLGPRPPWPVGVVR